MKDKLFEALKTKFEGVSDAILNRIAEKKAETVKENEIQTVVDGLSFQDVINNEADYRAAQTDQSVRKKLISEYEKKHGLKDGKPVDNSSSSNDNPQADPKKDEGDVPAWAKNLVKQNEELMNTVTNLTKTQQLTSKKETAKGLLAKSKIPETYREKWISRIDLENEDETIEDQVKSLEEEYTSIEQNVSNNSVSGKQIQGGNTEATSEELNEYLDDIYPEEQGAEK